MDSQWSMKLLGTFGGGCVEPEHIVLLIPQQIQHALILVDALAPAQYPDRSVFQMGIIGVDDIDLVLRDRQRYSCPS